MARTDVRGYAMGNSWKGWDLGGEGLHTDLGFDDERAELQHLGGEPADLAVEVIATRLLFRAIAGEERPVHRAPGVEPELVLGRHRFVKRRDVGAVPKGRTPRARRQRLPAQSLGPRRRDGAMTGRSGILAVVGPRRGGWLAGEDVVEIDDGQLEFGGEGADGVGESREGLVGASGVREGRRFVLQRRRHDDAHSRDDRTKGIDEAPVRPGERVDREVWIPGFQGSEFQEDHRGAVLAEELGSVRKVQFPRLFEDGIALPTEAAEPEVMAGMRESERGFEESSSFGGHDGCSAEERDDIVGAKPGGGRGPEAGQDEKGERERERAGAREKADSVRGGSMHGHGRGTRDCYAAEGEGTIPVLGRRSRRPCHLRFGAISLPRPSREPMSQSESSGFLAGVIEGFYGQPWAPAERRQLFEWMAAWGLNTYFYCLKDDWKNRAIWREDYSETELAALKELVRSSQAHGVHFLYGLSPGLDIRYASDADAASLRRRFEQMLGIGCRHFALLFDDIPDRIEPSDLARWGSLASAQCGVTNALFAWTRDRRPDARFLFCPTPYCSRMASAKLGGDDYLETVGRELAPEVEVLWTGPEIISETITVAHIETLTGVLRRKPVIWDNLHANDYDGGRFFCGPYSGRPTELKGAVNGILTNPNCEFALNYVPLRTLAAYLKSTGPWDPRAAYLEAMKEWLGEFGTSGQAFTVDELVLFGDSYYLPYGEGAEAARVFELVRGLLGRSPGSWGDDVTEARRAVARLRDICARMAELRNRPLFYALWRRAWALREETDMLDRYLGIRSRDPEAKSPAGSDYHLPGTYRGGMVAKLQRLLASKPDGSFEPARPQIP